MDLTLVEKKLLDALISVRGYLTGGSIMKRDFYDLMEIVRDGIKTAENKQYGCSTGKHSSYCTCRGDIEGDSTHYLKYGTYKKKGKTA